MALNLETISDLPLHHDYRVPPPEDTPSKDDQKLADRLLIETIPGLISNKHYKAVLELFQEEDEPTIKSEEVLRNVKLLPLISTELFRFCVKYLNEETCNDDVQLYHCSEELIKIIAVYGPVSELLLEFIDVIEECEVFDVYSSLLYGFQLLLIRRPYDKPKPLQWALQAVSQRIKTLPTPDIIYDGYDEQEGNLLEEDEELQSMFMYYILLEYFYNGLIEHFCDPRKRPMEQIYHCYNCTTTNVIIYNLIELVGRPPLALLNIGDTTGDYHETNAYSVQCAQKLTKLINRCVRNPFSFLYIIKERIHREQFPSRNKKLDRSLKSSNIYLNEEYLKLDCLGVYFYMILTEDVFKKQLPKIYAPMYVFECGFYLVNELLMHDEPPFQLKALKLMEGIMVYLGSISITVNYLEISTFQKFVMLLCNRITYSSQLDVRRLGITILRSYILLFNDDGIYFIIKNLLRTNEYQGVCGYVITLYKDLLHKAILENYENPSTEIDFPATFSGADFRSLFMHYICHLPNGVNTDLLEQPDRIISTLNILRFLALSDRGNLTGYWTFINDIKAKYLNVLKECLDLSEMHYKAELQKIEKMTEEQNTAQCIKDQKLMKMFNVSIAKNSGEKKLVEGENDNVGDVAESKMIVSRKEKLNILKRNFCTFDLIRSLIVRVNECIECVQNSLAA